MGRRNRTRKTKWLQLSLGSASGHDEEEDDQQVERQQQQSEEQQEQPPQQQESQEESEDTLETSRSSSASNVLAEPSKDVQGHPRPRRPYHRTYQSNNQWHYGHVTGTNSDEFKATGVQRKIINDEEYTKISTPRQEVLLKKGSIGKKKMDLNIPLPANDNEDTQNANGANLSGGVDAAGTEIPSPVYCYPMSYGGYYPQGIVMQEMYPGGPLVAAMPLALPMQPLYPYFYGETYNENQELDNDKERSRRNSADSSQASGSGRDSGSSENSESSSPEPLSPGSEALDPPSALSKVPVPVVQYPPLVYVYPAGYALAQPVYTNAIG